MRDSYENRRQEPRVLYARDERKLKLKLRHINTLQKKKKKKNTPTRTCTLVHEHILWQRRRGNMPVATVRSIIAEFGAPDGPCPATGPLAIAPLPKSPPRGGRQGGRKKEKKKAHVIHAWLINCSLPFMIFLFLLNSPLRSLVQKCAWLLLNFNALPLPWPAGKVCPPSALKREISNVVLLIMDVGKTAGCGWVSGLHNELKSVSTIVTTQ